MESGEIEYLGGAPVTINATNGAVINATFVIKLEENKSDTLRRFAESICNLKNQGTPLPVEFL